MRPVAEAGGLGACVEQRPFGLLDPPDRGERPRAEQERLGDVWADPAPAQPVEDVGPPDRARLIPASRPHPSANERRPHPSGGLRRLGEH